VTFFKNKNKEKEENWLGSNRNKENSEEIKGHELNNNMSLMIKK
jgi:hypothetical protein